MLPGFRRDSNSAVSLVAFVAEHPLLWEETGDLARALPAPGTNPR